jgi:Zn-dependent M16 (insulinase) family peptidase
MQVNGIYAGFRLVEERPVVEAGSLGRLFVHEKTGARLFHMENDDNNKVFGIGFRTPSDNSTGVAHICEHAVLNGSRKYRTKDPFMDLERTSLATFLNAMTYSDKTIYPVASRNDRDFRQLMDVYLDSVLHPLIYDRKETFLQEGWHYHLEHTDDPLVYSGVVYNEMRGALSGADDQIIGAVMAHLYPDTIYGKESGGDPYEIPQLTYEAFLDFHRRFYHPVNSYSFIYGDGPIQDYLALLDSYFSEFEPASVDSTIAWQAAFEAPREANVTYSVAPGDATEGKAALTYTVSLGSRRDLRDIFVSDILQDVLVDSQAAPIKLALMQAGIGADVSGFSSDGLQIPFGIEARDVCADQKEDFVRIIDQALRDCVEKGLDRDQVRAALNKIEYDLREAGGYATRGIIYYINAFETWLYDGSPFEALAYEAPLADLRRALDTDYFERFIQERILDNPHKLVLTALPEPGKNDRRDARMAQDLAAYKAGLSEGEVAALVDQTHKLLALQERQDTPEEKATLPRLTRADVTGEPDRVPSHTDHIGPARVLHQPLETGGVNYFAFAFDLDHFSWDDLPYVSLFVTLAGAVDTDKHTYAQLGTEEYLTSGGIGIANRVYERADREGHELDHRLIVTTKTLNARETQGALDLISEMLRDNDFSDKKRFREVVEMVRLQMQEGIFRQGHTVAAGRASSYHSPYGLFNERISGLDFLFFIQDLCAHFDDRFEAVRARVEDVAARLLTAHGLVASVTTDQESYDRIRSILSDWIGQFDDKELAHGDWSGLVPVVKNEGIASAANVQYVAKAADLGAEGVAYSGDLQVLAGILTNGYLYENIRTKGGAYGQGIRFSRNGMMTCYSYRDPNLGQTLAVFDGLPDCVAALDLDEETLTSYIIGVMNRFDPVMTVRDKGRFVLRLALTGLTHEDLARSQRQALAATVDGLRAYAEPLRRALAQNHLCALGSAARIEEEGDLFGTIVHLEN